MLSIDVHLPVQLVKSALLLAMLPALALLAAPLGERAGRWVVGVVVAFKGA